MLSCIGAWHKREKKSLLLILCLYSNFSILLIMNFCISDHFSTSGSIMLFILIAEFSWHIFRFCFRDSAFIHLALILGLLMYSWFLKISVHTQVRSCNLRTWGSPDLWMDAILTMQLERCQASLTTIILRDCSVPAPVSATRDIKSKHSVTVVEVRVRSPSK